jgi:hypothetical protein
MGEMDVEMHGPEPEADHRTELPKRPVRTVWESLPTPHGSREMGKANALMDQAIDRVR